MTSRRRRWLDGLDDNPENESTFDVWVDQIRGEGLRTSFDERFDRTGGSSLVPGQNGSNTETPPLDGPGIGEVLAGYEVIEYIGEGGFAHVYKVRKQRESGEPRFYALKLLRFMGSESPEFLKVVNGLFVKELEELDRHRGNPHIVAVLFDDDFMDRPFFIMELADTTLRNLRAKYRGTHRIVKLRLASQVTEALGSAMTALHQSGKAHQDIKPENILIKYQDRSEASQDLLTENDAIWIADLGVAADLPPEESRPIPRTGSARASSPERPDGALPWGSVQDDLFAATQVIYFCLFGESLVRGISWETELREQKTNQSLATSLANGLRKDPANRHGTANEWKKDLTESLQEAIEYEERMNRHNKLLVLFAIFGALALFALVGAATYSVYTGSPPWPTDPISDSASSAETRPPTSEPDPEPPTTEPVTVSPSSEVTPTVEVTEQTTSVTEPTVLDEDDDEVVYVQDEVADYVENRLAGTQLTATVHELDQINRFQVKLIGDAIEDPSVVETIEQQFLDQPAIVDVDTTGVITRYDMQPGTDLGALLGYDNLAFPYFESDVAKDSPAAIALTEIARLVVDYPEISSIEVGGFTDAVGSAQRNDLIGQQRAESAARFLVENGVPEGAVQTKSYGESCPIPGATPETERRVTVVVVSTTEASSTFSPAC